MAVLIPGAVYAIIEVSRPTELQAFFASVTKYNVNIFVGRSLRSGKRKRLHRWSRQPRAGSQAFACLRIL